MRYIFKFKAYAIQLNTNAYIEKTTITAWLAENIQGYILDHQMINVIFFSKDDAFLFHLIFFSCMQSFYLRELEYKPQNEKMLNILMSHYQSSIIK